MTYEKKKNQRSNKYINPIISNRRAYANGFTALEITKGKMTMAVHHRVSLTTFKKSLDSFHLLTRPTPSIAGLE